MELQLQHREHYPDGYKAQIIAIDREAIVLYKRALDELIARDLEKRGDAVVDPSGWIAAPRVVE